MSRLDDMRHDLAELVEASATTIARLENALQTYGRHKDWCADKHDKPCTCGLAAHLPPK